MRFRSIGRPAPRRIAVILVAGFVAAATATATSARPTASAPKCTKSPVNVAVQYLDNNPIVVSNQMIGAANAAARYVNSHGCLAGHPAHVVSCYGMVDANSEAACTRQLIAQNPVAVSLNAITEASLLPLWQQAGVPLLGWYPIGGSTLNSSVTTSFPLQGTSLAYYEAPALWLFKHKGQSKIAVLATATASGNAASAQVKSDLEAAGASVTVVSVPPTAVDMSPYVASAHAAGATTAIIFLGANSGVQFVAADSASPRPFTYYTGTYYNASLSLLTKYGQAYKKLVVGSAFPTIDAKIKGAIIFKDALNREFRSGDKNAAPAIADDHSWLAWLTILTLQTVAPNVKSWTGAGVADAVAKAKNLTFKGVINPWSPGNIPSTTRLANPYIRVIGFTAGGKSKDFLSKPLTLAQIAAGKS
jgi:ABC-type branched-subunit amino acid transport system substrate-binding protein